MNYIEVGRDSFNTCFETGFLALTASIVKLSWHIGLFARVMFRLRLISQ